jgi:hypothetical protein
VKFSCFCLNSVLVQDDLLMRAPVIVYIFLNYKIFLSHEFFWQDLLLIFFCFMELRIWISKLNTLGRKSLIICIDITPLITKFMVSFGVLPYPLRQLATISILQLELMHSFQFGVFFRTYFAKRCILLPDC